MQSAFIPRVGELVLWIRPVDGEIRLEPQLGEYKIFDDEMQLFVGFPEWLGGVVTQVPDEGVALEDIFKESQMADDIENSGFRVECLSRPNLKRKDLASDYSYVPLKCIRPFALWREMMHGIPKMSCHPTVRHWLTAMAIISVTERCGFKGSLPNADFYAKGIFHGPEDHGKINISSASNFSCILSGPTYTILPSKSLSNLAVVADNEDHPIPECMRGYGPW